jgi:hypothetical protein
MDAMNKKAVLGLLALVAVFALIGIWEESAETGPDAPGPGPAGARAAPPGEGAGMFGRLSRLVGADDATPAVSFIRWQHPQGLFSADVPAGWRIEGKIDPQGMDKGAFMIQGFAPDGRAMFSFSHNWNWFMEYQYGPYRPGHATVESLVLPNLSRNLPQLKLSGVRVTYRGPNTSFQLVNPLTGLPLRTDQGTLGLLAMNAQGEALAGTLMGETLYMPVPGSPGLWGLRLFSGGLAPADSASQAAIQAIQAKVVESFEPSAEFLRTWQQSHKHTVDRMRDYSRQMDRVFERYLSSTRRSSSASKDPMQGWAEMMRGGHYERDDRTGEDHWVGNNHKYWWKNDQDVIVGNDTGQPPYDNGNWHPLGAAAKAMY